MSHAITAKLLGVNVNEVILVYRSSWTRIPSFYSKYSKAAFLPVGAWRDTIIMAAGSMGNIAFSTCKLALAIILKKYITLPIALILGMSSLIWIVGELGYTFFSALQMHKGDYDRIAQHGNIYLAVASTAMFAECILAAFILTKLASYH